MVHSSKLCWSQFKVVLVTAQSCLGHSSKLSWSQFKELVTAQSCVGHSSKLVRLILVHVGLSSAVDQVVEAAAIIISLVILVSLQDV